MKVTSIRLQGLNTVDLPLYVAKPSDPYIIKAADGLGAPGYDVSIVGNVYQGRVARNRELVFRLGLTPNYRLNQTASDLRDQLYGLLMPANADGSIPIQFMNGDQIVASTQGWVSNIEPVIFAKEPEVQLTFPCNAAYLLGADQKYVVPTTKAQFTITNEGTAPTGIELEVVMTKNVAGFAVNFNGGFMNVEYDFQVGDILHIDTRDNSRSIRFTRAGVEKEIIHALSRDSVWIVLHGGSNQFTMGATNFNWGFVRYTPLFQGV